MAITFVGSHVGTHQSVSAETVNFSSLKDESNATPTLLPGDIVFVAIENASTIDRSQSDLTPPGYTAAHTDDYRNDANDSNFLVSYKIMGATPDSSVNIPASNATSAAVGYAIYVFRGVDPSTPLDVSPVVAGGTDYGVADAGAITPATAGAWILAFGGAAVNGGLVFTNPSGMSTTTNHFRSATTTPATNDAIIGGAIYTGWSSGSYDPPTFGGGSSLTTGSWSAVTIALRPMNNHAVTGSEITAGAPAMDAASIAQAHTVSGSEITNGAPTLDAVNLAQNHALGGSEITGTAPAFDAAGITEGGGEVSVSGDPIEGSAPVFDAASITQSHVLIGNEITGQPQIETMALSQGHVVAPADLLAGQPFLDGPSVAQGHVLAGSEPTLSGATIDSPAIVVSHGLIGTEITGSPPLTDSPSMGQGHAFPSADLLCGQTILDAGVFNQGHLLNGSDLIGGAPVFDSATLLNGEIVVPSARLIAGVAARRIIYGEANLSPSRIAP